MFDEGGKGFINEDDLLQVMTRLGEDSEQAKELFLAADVNGDGTISWEEFVTLMTASC